MRPRVALVSVGAADLVRAAVIRTVAAAVYVEADLIAKVKEPQPPEYPLLREGQVLFTYLHLAAAPELTKALLDRQIICIAYETVQLDDGSLPLLAPMSEVAGKMSVQLEAPWLPSCSRVGHSPGNADDDGRGRIS
jgi:alanine dehydrogenase